MFPAIGLLVDSGMIVNKPPPDDHIDAANEPPSSHPEAMLNNYLASLNPPSTLPPDGVLSYEIDISSSYPSLPSPQTAWLARDVDHENWNTFLLQLAEVKGDAAAQAQAVEQWNVSFFRPRGCRVTMSAPARTEDMRQYASSAEAEAGRWGSPTTVRSGESGGGSEAKLGNVMVGVIQTGKENSP